MKITKGSYTEIPDTIFDCHPKITEPPKDEELIEVERKFDSTGFVIVLASVVAMLVIFVSYCFVSTKSLAEVSDDLGPNKEYDFRIQIEGTNYESGTAADSLMTMTTKEIKDLSDNDILNQIFGE